VTLRAYYNEFEPYAAQWIRNLIADGIIPAGDVDERSITEVQPDDLRGYGQCHFFAGLAGWPYALRRAGWSDTRPIWTGSCPCQPFSVAGKGAGKDDPRHLWPDFFRLIEACRPAVVMGEQVAGSAGEDWFDGVAADLERADYAARAVDIPAAAVDAPHIRQRLYWCAVGNFNALRGLQPERRVCDERGWASDTSVGVLADTNCRNPREGRGDDGEMRRISAAQRQSENSTAVFGGSREGYRDMADADDAGREGRLVLPQRADERSAWSDGMEWRSGADGKARRVKSGVRLLADGIPARTSKLRALGNAICAPLAEEVIRAFMEWEP
jgi:DNA (cytosine-5)-methyltransferase 1